MPKLIKKRMAVTSRIITLADIENVLTHIKRAELEGRINHERALEYTAFIMFSAYTGQRSMATTGQLTVRQFRDAIKHKKPVIHVKASQDKIRYEHYVPLHSVVVGAINEVLAHDFEENDDAKPFFMYNSFEKWLERQKIPLPRVRDPSKAHLWLGDFRKFAEQFGDVIGWDSTNRKYVLAHAMTGVDWEHYKRPFRKTFTRFTYVLGVASTSQAD
ncbi:MAG: hypothetical protein ACXV3E_06530 [Halobacteriota archaeon]